ncbi:Putative heavy-metal-binding protein [uncultured archaeon]|nr:Putative heavy-metal-binding protein [uncultured archaeon]
MKIIVSTTDSIPGWLILEHVGIAWGSSVKTKHIIREFVSLTKSFIGGNIRDYSSVLNESRSAALQDLIVQAEKIGGNAIIGLNFTTSSLSSGLVEVCAYGTVVKAKRLKTSR